MNAETNKIKARLASLNASFSELESLLDPLFAQSLPETLVGLEPLQQAKLQTVLPYLVYDLIFIYLKSRGIDPKTHPVVPELDRIRGYFEKISSAENPPIKRTELDKAAASRFIKHAISQAQSQWKKTAAEDAQDDDTAAAVAPSSSSVPVKITSKMRARAEYEAEVRRADEAGEEESDLVVVDGEEDEDEDEESTKMDVDVDDEVGLTNSNSKSKSKGKGKETSSTTTTTTTSNKRRRPAIDHFAGYGDDAPQPSLSTEPSKKAKSSPETSSSPPESTAPSPALGESDKSKSSSSSNKKSKKKAKKAAAAAASSS